MSNLLPPSVSELEINLVEVTTSAVNKNISDLSELWNADTCPVKFLPWLAWAEGVEEWSQEWAEQVQRAVIKTTRETRRYRGTAKAVIDAVAGFGGIATVTEWFQQSPPGVPGTFDVTITGGDNYIEAGLQTAMISAIDRNKNARSHYVLGVGLTMQANLYQVGIGQVVNYVRLNFTEE